MTPEPKKIVLASGKIRYRAVVGIGKHENGKRKQLTITKDTSKEVKAEISRIENEQNTGTFVPPHLLMVNQWIDRWLEKKAEDLEELGHIKLQELTEEDVEAWMSWSLKYGRLRGGKAGTPLGVTTVDMALARLKDCLNRAVTKRLVKMNVAQHLSIPRKARKAERKTKDRLEPWNVREVHTFVLGMSGDRLYAPLLLSLMGHRPAEVCGLRWVDIDLDNDTSEAGLRQVRLYDARASCFTYLANNWVPDHLLARWAGHTNVKTTKRWYVKPDVEDLRDAAATWGGLHSAQEGGV